MKYLLALPWILSQGAAFSIWGHSSSRLPISSSKNIKIFQSNSALRASEESDSYDYNGFNEKLKRAYDEWCETYGDSIDESRMEIFSYHFVMAENYFKETGNRIKLNEYADLTAVEFQRLKEMGGMIQDVKQDNPHWVPEEDAAQMDYFAKQTSQRQQAFQDNKKQSLPTPPPGYFSVLPVPENGSSTLESSPSSPPNVESSAPSSTSADPYEQRFTQDYLDSLNTQAAEAESGVNQAPPPPSLPKEGDNTGPTVPTGGDSSKTYMFEIENNLQQGNQQQQQQQPQPREGPELQDLINSRYDGIGFLEDSAMDSSSSDDSYKFLPALSKMYNLDYPEKESDVPPPPPPSSPDSSEIALNQPSADKKETFMNAMSALYSQMFGEGGAV